MVKLTNCETQLLDQFFLSNNFTEITEAHFYSALHEIVPLWRLEELAGNRIFTHEPTIAYKEYIKNLAGAKHV